MRPDKCKPITCAPDCDWHEYLPSVPPRYRSDETGLEGAEDGDLY